VSQQSVPLDLDSVLAEARETSGLDDFGDESFRGPLERLLAALDGESGLHAIGRATQRARVVNILVNRARIEDDYRHHPEIAGERIVAPVVIAGLPRTGTTLLQRVLAEDPAFDAVRWYECRNPAPFPGWDWSSRDPRIADAEEEVRITLETVPELATTHPFDPLGPDEEIMLLEHSFYSRMAESYACMPRFRAWLAAQDQTPGYEYLSRALRHLQWQHRRLGRARERWVLKSPHHLGHMELLFRQFPEARVIQTHRDPVQSVPSIASMVHLLWRLGNDRADPREAGRQWSDNLAGDLRACTAFRDGSGLAGRFLDVWFLDSVKDPIGVVRRILDWLGRDLTPVAEERMRAWARDNAREKRPPHEYTLEQYGLSEAGIEHDFAAYRERFVLGR
jgi:hypothetical protein